MSISKLVINLMSGMLGQFEKEGSRVKISNNIDQIFHFLDKYHHWDEGIMINRIADTDYFMFGFNQKVVFNSFFHSSPLVTSPAPPCVGGFNLLKLQLLCASRRLKNTQHRCILYWLPHSHHYKPRRLSQLTPVCHMRGRCLC